MKKINSLECLDAMPITEIISNYDAEAEYTFGVPTYKRYAELEDALDSIYEQKTKIKFNVIVSDNNPEQDDETALMIKKKYGARKNLFYFKNQESIGSTNNWNRLFQYCKTKYLIMLHDDDVLFNNYLEAMDYFVKRMPNVSALNCRKITWDGKSEIRHHGTPSREIIRHNIYTNFLHFSFGTPSGCLFNLADVREIGGYNEEYGNALDYTLIMELLLRGKLCVQTKNELMLYRWGNNASTKFEVLHNLLENDYRLKCDVAESAKISSWVKEMFCYFDIKIRLRSIKKINGKSLTFMGYRPGGMLFMVLYKVFYFIYNNIYIEKICSCKV